MAQEQERISTADSRRMDALSTPNADSDGPGASNSDREASTLADLQAPLVPRRAEASSYRVSSVGALVPYRSRGPRGRLHLIEDVCRYGVVGIGLRQISTGWIDEPEKLWNFWTKERPWMA